MKHSTAGFTIHELALGVLLAVVIAAVASFATYAWQHKQVNDLNGKVSSLNAKINSQDDQISALSAQLKKACQPTGQSSANPTCTDYTYTSSKNVSVSVFTPAKNATVTSPVAVVGEVPGNWSFEAQFPVQLKNSKGDTVAQATAHVLGNWQTTELVPFSVQLTYTTAESGSGTIVMQKDNPSGLPQNADSVSIPIKF